uniref:Glycosyltransferase n=1 Tax=Leersia perrieri TaxID=77586 RepID=A0A0D9X4T1_9ORYZ
MARPHAVVVPYPGSGNINPALQLAKLLHAHGVHITFVNTEHNHRRVVAAEGAAAVRGRDGFRFETIPDGVLDADRDAADYDLGLSVATTTRCAAPLRELVARINGGGGDADAPPVTCMVFTALMSFALEVAREMGLPTMVLWGGSAASLMAHMNYPTLTQLNHACILHFADESLLTNGYLDMTIIDWITGMPPISLGDISSFVRTTDPNDFGLRFNETEANNCTKANALILNTFDDLEADVLTALRAEYQCIFTVGPLGTLLIDTSEKNSVTAGVGLSLWKHDIDCLAWLDTQKPGSVVYVNLGSLTVLTPEQLAEFAWGIAATGRPFLWVIRENLVPGGMMKLPTGFAAATEGRRCLSTWCPQDQVLCHRAVGCFLTHNGWNSTCEGVAAGLPMVCWPVFADQYTNCKYACEVWGVGVRLDDKVRREQVTGHIKLAMESDEMWRSANKWKVKAEVAAQPGEHADQWPPRYNDHRLYPWHSADQPWRHLQDSSFMRMTDPNDFGRLINETKANNYKKDDTLILQTFDNLEANVLISLHTKYPLIYIVSPLGTLPNRWNSTCEGITAGVPTVCLPVFVTSNQLQECKYAY